MASDRLSPKNPRFRITLQSGSGSQDGEGKQWAGRADEVPYGTIAPERLHLILQRIATRFYDSAEVCDQIARRVLLDLT